MDRRGFGLLGAVAGMAITGAGLLATYRMLAGAMAAQRAVGQKSELGVLRSQLQGLLQDKEVCASLLKNKRGDRAKFNPDRRLPERPSAAEIEAYKQENSLEEISLPGMVLTKSDQAQGSLHVVEHALREVDREFRSEGELVAEDGVRTRYRQHLAKLTIRLERRSNSGGSAVHASLEFPLFVAVDNSGGATRYDVVQCSEAPERSVATAISSQILGVATRYKGYNSSSVAFLAPPGTRDVIVRYDANYGYGHGWTSEDKTTLNAHLNLGSRVSTGTMTHTGGNGAGSISAYDWQEQRFGAPFRIADGDSGLTDWASGVAVRPTFDYDTATRTVRISGLYNGAQAEQGVFFVQFFGQP